MSFHPKLCKEARNGYFYLFKSASGLGSASFKLAESNGNSTFDVLQATTSQQPSVISSNSKSQFHFDFAANQRTLTSGSVTAGWTGATYIGMWYRLPSGTPNNGTTTIFAHNTVGVGLRRISIASDGTNNRHAMTVSVDGTAVQQDTWADQGDSNWYWHEWIYTPSVGADHYRDFVLVSHVATVINIASLNNPSVPLAIGAATGAALNVNDQDIGFPIVYGNGTPSIKSRKRLANMSSASGIKFQI